MLGLEDLFPPRKQSENAAPFYEVTPCSIVAIEHPCKIVNLDNGIKSFGPHPNFEGMLSNASERISVPVWLRPGNPTSKPIMSHEAASNNVVLKITVPKRTGRKRKRGSDEPFSGEIDMQRGKPGTVRGQHVSSVSRRDEPEALRRKLRDNETRYTVEALGPIRNTHRFRGLSDFQFKASDFPFLQKVADHLLPMKVSKLREFRFEPGQDTSPDQKIIPPPHFTDKIVPFNYFYEQNPYVRADGVDESGNLIMSSHAKVKKLNIGHYIQYNHYPVPVQPLQAQQNIDQVTAELTATVRGALDSRPIWTRRSLLNFVGMDLRIGTNTSKYAIYASGYQFRGGPWRDGILKYGLDPRTDPKYRVYQTLAFKLHEMPQDCIAFNGKVEPLTKETTRNSHKWDGQSFCTNGKFWQICDITDPALVKLIEDAPLREVCDIVDSGWFHAGTWAKIKAYMRAKMVAIRSGRLGDEEMDNPKKPGYLYPSVMLEKLSQWPDIVPDHLKSAVNAQNLLYGLEDVEGLEGLRYRNRTVTAVGDVRTQLGMNPVGRAPKATREKRKRLLGDLPGGETQAEGDGSYVGSRDQTEEAAQRDGEEPDGPWQQMLDSDVGSDGEDEDPEE